MFKQQEKVTKNKIKDNSGIIIVKGITIFTLLFLCLIWTYSNSVISANTNTHYASAMSSDIEKGYVKATFNFGSFPQTKVTDENLKNTLNSLTKGSDDTVTYYGDRYLYEVDNVGTGAWYKFEPIKWQILKIDEDGSGNGKIVAVSESVLESRTWDTQTSTKILWDGTSDGSTMATTTVGGKYAYPALRLYLNSYDSSGSYTCDKTVTSSNHTNEWKSYSSLTYTPGSSQSVPSKFAKFYDKGFLEKAFTEEERAVIIPDVNEFLDLTHDGTASKIVDSNRAHDKIRLLSGYEMFDSLSPNNNSIGTKYDFASSHSTIGLNTNRIGFVTDYSASKYGSYNGGSWSASPPYDEYTNYSTVKRKSQRWYNLSRHTNTLAVGVNRNGSALMTSYIYEYEGVRPALSLNLSSLSSLGVNIDFEAWDRDSDYTFKQWKVNDVVSSTNCPDGHPEKYNGVSISDVKNIKAVFGLKVCTLTFDYNGGTKGQGDPDTIVVSDRDTIGIMPSPTKTGYTFGGWFSDNETFLSEVTSTDMLISDLTVYAKWTPVSYDITYTLNEGTVSTSNPITYNVESEDITLNNPTRTGYTFSGWTGTGLSQASDTVTISKGSTGHRSYEATWTANTNTAYTVRHYKMDIGGSSYTLSDTDNLTGTSDAPLTISDLQKTYEGFAYEGGKAADATTTKPSSFDTSSTILPDGTRNINIYYSRNQHTVTLAKGTGIESVTGNGTYYYGASVTLGATVSSGYTWSKWIGTGVSDSTTQAYSFTMPDSNVSLTANASVNTYTNSLIYNTNTGNSDGPETQTYEVTYPSTSHTFTLSSVVPTKTGYTFAGWYTAASGGTEIAGSVTVGSDNKTEDQTITVYAHWTANTYKVKFVGNGNTSGSMSDETFSYDETKSLTTNAFERKYEVTFDANGGTPSSISTLTNTYSFKEWNTSSDGTGTTYTNGQSVSNLSSTDNGEITLYAIWEEPTSPITLPSVICTGHTLSGWFTALTGGTKKGDAGDTIILTSDLNLHAIWDVENYTVSFDTKGGNTISDRSYTYPETFGTLEVPNRLGWLFEGWYKDASYSVRVNESDLVTSNQTIYARWLKLESISDKEYCGEKYDLSKLSSSIIVKDNLGNDVTSSLSSLGVSITYGDDTHDNKTAGSDKGIVKINKGGNSSQVLFSITRREILFDASVAPKTYDGTVNIDVSSITITPSNVISGDDVIISKMGAYKTKTAGDNKEIDLTLSLVGTDAGNYSIVSSKTISTGKIDQKEIEYQVTVDNKAYDGSDDARSKTTITILPGMIVGTDDVNVTLFSSTFASSNKGTNITVNVVTELAGTDKSNYCINQKSGLKADIVNEIVKLEFTNPTSKVYDGTTDATELVIISKITKEDGTVLSSVPVSIKSIYFDDKNAGSGKTINIIPEFDNDLDKTSYRFERPIYSISGGEITKKELDFNISVREKTYDGTKSASGIVIQNSITGLVSGDQTPTITLKDGEFTSENAADNISATFNCEVTSTNYSVPSVKTGEGKITKKDLHIDATTDDGDYEPGDTLTVHFALRTSDFISGEESGMSLSTLSGTGTVQSTGTGLGRDVLIENSEWPTVTGSSSTLSNYNIVHSNCVVNLTRLDLSNEGLSITLVCEPYNGESKVVSAIIKITRLNKTLIEGTDYLIEYLDDHTSVGTHNVKITFIGDYKGTKTSTYEIKDNRTPTPSGGGGGGGASITIGTLPIDTQGKIITYKKAYMNGYEDGTFRPSVKVSREEVATIVARSHEQFDEGVNFTSFNDFNDANDRWSKNYIGFCRHMGLINGYDDGNYKPNNYMTRAELATLVSNFQRVKNAEIPEEKLHKAAFKDVDGRWYEEAVNKLVYLGILNGYEDGTFKGDNYVSRIEVAIVMNKINGRNISGEIPSEYVNKVLNTFKDVNKNSWYFKDALEATVDLPDDLFSK